MATSFGAFWRKSVPFIYLGGGVMTGFAIMYPNTLGLDDYRKLVVVRNQFGTEEMVDKEFVRLADEISDKLRWSKEQRERTKLFPCMWIDFIHKGSCNTMWGAAIGIPGHLIPSLEVMDKTVSSGRLGNFTIDFTSPAGQNLRKSLDMMATSDAKKFSLAKEMCELSFYNSYLTAGFTAMTIPGAYVTTKFLQVVTGFYTTRFLRMLSYAVVFPSVFVGHVFLKDAYNCRVQEKIDDKLVALGPEMAQGGADYYSALLLRNQSLLSLCGRHGSKNITHYGNLRSWWRRPEPLLTERRDKMMKAVAQGL